jgi:hypothetical protein
VLNLLGKKLGVRSQTFLRKSWGCGATLWKESVEKTRTWDVKPSWERAKNEESNHLEEELRVSCHAVEKIWREGYDVSCQTFLRKYEGWGTTLSKKSIEKAITWGVKPSWFATLWKKSAAKTTTWGVKPSWERAEVSCHVVKKLWRETYDVRCQTSFRKS